MSIGEDGREDDFRDNFMLPPIDERKQIERPRATASPAVRTDYAVPETDRNAGAGGDLQTLTAVLWRGKLIIAAAAIWGLLVGGMVSLVSKPVYRAHTSLQLEGFNDLALRVSPVSPLPNASPVDYLQNEVKVLESDTLARRVADQLNVPANVTPGRLEELISGVKQRLGLGSAQAPDPASLDQRRVARVRKAITVRTGVQSQVMDVYFDAANPILAARGANAVASEFINLNRDARSQLIRDTTEWLNRQAVELKAKLESANQRLQDFTARSGLIVAGQAGTPAQDRLRQLQDSLTRAEADRAAKQARYEAAVASQGQITADELSSGTLRQYATDLQTMRRQLADLRTIYTPDNYRITRLEAQIAETEAAIKKEHQEAISRLRNEYLAAAALEKTLSQSLAHQTAVVERQTEKQLQYDVLRNEVDTDQKLYDSVLERANDAGTASSLRVTNIRVIDPATVPLRPYSPILPLNMALGLGIGAVGGAGLVLLRTRSTKIRHPGELTSLYVPELGVVPSARSGLVVAGQRPARATSRNTFDSSLLRESFRAVLTSTLFSSQFKHGARSRPGHANGRVLVVTSLDMMEGKTTIVTNLGMASAQQNREVLLIDADFRRPRLHQRFGLPNRAGLADLLQHPDFPELLDSSTLESVIQPTEIPHLWLLTSGPTDEASANLLYSPGFDTLLQSLARRFDLIFIDTPPMLMYADARALGQMSDGVVMVVRANTKSREELRAAYQRLLQDQIPVLGTILNDWKPDREQSRAYARYRNYYHQ